MHTRFKLRRYEVLAERSEALADAAERLVGDLLGFAERQQSAALSDLTTAYCRAIADVREAARTGAYLPPYLFQLEAIGRDVALALNVLQAKVLARAKEEDPPDRGAEALAPGAVAIGKS